MAFFEIGTKAIIETIISNISTDLIKIGAEKIKNIKIFQNPINSDGYLKLTSEELIKFYRKDNHFMYEIRDELYIVAGKLIFEKYFGINVDKLIDNKKITYKYTKNKFELDNSIRSFTKRIINKINNSKNMYNGNTVRLSNIKQNKIILSDAKYFDALVSNYAMDLKLDNNRNETLREYLHPTHKLPPFKNSKLANHIGVVAMIETSDGFLIGQLRSKKVANNAKTLSSSASGTIEPIDLTYQDDNFISGIFSGIKREASYELGVTLNEKETYFLGAIRDYKRGGLPDFYFYTKINKNFKDIKNTYQTSPEAFEIDDLLGLDIKHNNLNEFLDKIIQILSSSHESNITFDAGLLLYVKFILSNKYK